MNAKSTILLVMILSSVTVALAQIPAEVYKQPLQTVLSDIESRYHVKLLYDEKDITHQTVAYARWRYRSNIRETLNNILLPCDLIYEDVGNNIYEIRKYEYYRRPVQEGKAHLDTLLASYPSLALWEKRKETLRQCILTQLGLWPLPRKNPLNPIYTSKRSMDGYTVENVAIETLPGYYLCGSLYRPSTGHGPFPAVLCPHGHFYNKKNTMKMDERGRYRPDQQYRCAMLARMGSVVFSYNMFAYGGESSLQISLDNHRTGLALTMQTWNSMRVIDFLSSLDDVDTRRIGVTAASGGGTQTLLIAALDERISVSVPVVMVSSYFFGGCPCESGLPIHQCIDLGTNNAEIAAMAAPRPELVISDGSDWTKHVPEIEFPYLKAVYALCGKKENVENAHLASENHDYGVSKRKAMYDFMARHLGLNISRIMNNAGVIDESTCTIEKSDAMFVFGVAGKLPAHAIQGPEAIRKALQSLQYNAQGESSK